MAGFLYLVFGCDETLAFGSMKEVIERYSMSELFNEKLPMVKLMFYQLDRLIAIFLPDLHNHFKVSHKTFISNISNIFFSSVGRNDQFELL